MIGRTVGHYRVLEHLGGGGMGVVYRAEDTRLERMVALKFLPPELTRDEEARKRFLREARAASQLDHNNICTVYDVGEADGQTWIAMAYYDGETLKKKIERGPMGLGEALAIAVQIARGLGKAHASRIVHRDVKPANVMVTADGVVKIVDFGLAKLTDASLITQSTQTLGTLAYMAPEQIRGEPVGPQADLWSLGVVVFELLAGQRPFRGEYSQAIAFSILNEQPVSLAELRPDAPAELERVVRKLLRKDPLQRYQNADEVIAELEALRSPGSGSGKSGPRAMREREALRAGSRLGPYEIVEALGSGGMGDVYRARDTRLDRQVAIKVLAPEFFDDTERRQRFQREARTISSLSHPNICTLFDVGEQEGIDYLVMECLDGETLADRLMKGPLPLGDLLKTGIQICEALGAAHRQGVVHRDLKPGNVVLTKSGTVKLVDFGLAKDLGAITAAPARRSSPPPDKPLTAEGAIIGTLAYMAPEQVEGRDADARSDIFAFGAILHEMATGRRAFEGATRASLIAAILTAEPKPLPELRVHGASSSGNDRNLAAVERVVRQCLVKDPERRRQSALDVANELRWTSEKGAETEAAAPGGATDLLRWRTASGILAVVAAAAIGLAIWSASRSTRPSRSAPEPAPKLVRLTWELGNKSRACVSPDGSSFVFASEVSGNQDLYLRRVGGENSINLTKDHPGSDEQPAFSPDGQSIAFRSERDGGGIFIMGATGESVRRLTDFGFDPAWSPDGTRIAFSGESSRARLVYGLSGLWVVDVASGVRTKIHDGLAIRPAWSPSGTRIAFHTMMTGEGRSILSLPAVGGATSVLVSNGVGVEWTREWVWFSRGGNLHRVRANEATGRVIGEEERVTFSPTQLYGPSAAADGRRILLKAESISVEILTQEFDPATGRISNEPKAIVGGVRPFGNRIYPSPDGDWLMMQTYESFAPNILLIRIGTGETRLLTTSGVGRGAMHWANDSSRVYYSLPGSGKKREIWSIRTDGSGRERVVFAGDEGLVWPVVSPDGTLLCAGDAGKSVDYHLFDLTLPVEKRVPIALPPLPDGRSFQAHQFSPDGKWILGSPYAGNAARPDLKVILYDVSRKLYHEVCGLDGNYWEWSLDWFPDSRRILLWRSGESELKILDRTTGRLTSAGTMPEGLTNIALARDGRSIYLRRPTTQ
ncbi:MAG: protein kinase, partial [Thermoanaerobaculia bacterium]|nr:protein kinase [Thermoanaerobaculia bacterium]